METTTTFDPARLASIIHEAAIQKWLRTPNAAFRMQTPQQVIASGGWKQIEIMLYRLESGEPI